MDAVNHTLRTRVNYFLDLFLGTRKGPVGSPGPVVYFFLRYDSFVIHSRNTATYALNNMASVIDCPH